MTGIGALRPVGAGAAYGRRCPQLVVRRARHRCSNGAESSPAGTSNISTNSAEAPRRPIHPIALLRGPFCLPRSVHVS